VALVVDAAMRLVPTIAPLANVAAVALAMGAVVLVERSRGLAIAAAGFAVVAILLQQVLPGVIVARVGVVIPSISMMQAVAGVVLFTTGLGLRRWPAVLPERVLPPFVREFAAVAG
jgi:hypothetical protein